MKRTKFLIPSLLAAGFGSQDSAQATITQLASGGGDDPSAGKLFKVFKQDHAVQLAQHRSHSSHSSHSSHRSGGGGHYSHTSHRSSTGGGYDDYSAPVYVSPAPAPAPSVPSLPFRNSGQGQATPPQQEAVPSLSGRSERFKAIVRRVQIGLLAQGDYNGAIDGVVGPSMRGAIRKFQTSRGLPVTGTITSEVLDALRVSSE